MRQALRDVAGVVSAEVSYDDARATVVVDEGVDASRLVRAVRDAGFGASVIDGE